MDFRENRLQEFKGEGADLLRREVGEEFYGGNVILAGIKRSQFSGMSRSFWELRKASR